MFQYGRAMRAPTLYSHKFLYVGAAIGRPFDKEETFFIVTGLETVCRSRQTTKYAHAYLPFVRFTHAGRRPVSCAVKK